MTQFFLFFFAFIYSSIWKESPKNFFDFGSFLTEISQKSFLGICHVPGLSVLADVVQIYLEKAQNDRNEINYKLIESFFWFKAWEFFFSKKIEFFDFGKSGFWPTLRLNSQKTKSSNICIYLKKRNLRLDLLETILIFCLGWIFPKI